MPRGGFRGGKPPTKSATGEKAKMVAFRLTPETIVQLESVAESYGCNRTALIERLIAQAPPDPTPWPQDADVEILRRLLQANQQGRSRLSTELAEATEREVAYLEEIGRLQAELEQGGPSWAHGVLHLPPDASVEDVNRAYRDLSKRFHPDANPNDPDATRLFRDLVTARDYLLG